jgi:hypothetical protein
MSAQPGTSSNGRSWETTVVCWVTCPHRIKRGHVRSFSHTCTYVLMRGRQIGAISTLSPMPQGPPRTCLRATICWVQASRTCAYVLRRGRPGLAQLAHGRACHDPSRWRAPGCGASAPFARACEEEPSARGWVGAANSLATPLPARVSPYLRPMSRAPCAPAAECGARARAFRGQGRARGQLHGRACHSATPSCRS